MKIIDKQGRLFGRVNVIDLAFIIILVLALVVGGKRLRGSSVTAETREEGQVTLSVQNIRQASVDNIEVGQQIYHYDKGVYMGDIVNVEVEPYTQQLDYEGQWVDAPVPGKYSVLIDIKVEGSESEKAYIVGGEEVRVGGEFRLKTKTSTFSGHIVDIDIGK